MSKRSDSIATTVRALEMGLAGRDLNIHIRGHKRRAFVEGFRAGQVAELGGTPLSKYKRAGVRQAFDDGFAAGQKLRKG